MMVSRLPRVPVKSALLFLGAKCLTCENPRPRVQPWYDPPVSARCPVPAAGVSRLARAGTVTDRRLVMQAKNVSQVAVRHVSPAAGGKSLVLPLLVIEAPGH
jgi:hypothetical protein